MPDLRSDLIQAIEFLEPGYLQRARKRLLDITAAHAVHSTDESLMVLRTARRDLQLCEAVAQLDREWIESEKKAKF